MINNFIIRVQKAHKIAKNECKWALKEDKRFIYIYPFAYMVCLFFKVL